MNPFIAMLTHATGGYPLEKPEAVVVQGVVGDKYLVMRENGDFELCDSDTTKLRMVKQGDFIPSHILALTPQGQQMLQQSGRLRRV